MLCPKCGYKIEEDWIVCPKCGLPLEPPTPEAIVGQMVTRILGGLVEAGFIEERSVAERKGEKERAEIAEIGRSVAKDIENMISEAITAYDYQERIRRRKEKAKK
jgi:DNA-binding HxlR family transcriptional regulator